MAFTLTQFMALKYLNAIDAVENAICQAAETVDHYLISPDTRLTTTMCRKFIENCENLEVSLKQAGASVQKTINNLHSNNYENDKKSGASTIYNGLQKISQANTYMGTAILKNIQLVKLDLSTKEPNKSHKDDLKKDICRYKQKAIQSFNEGKKLVLEGIKLAAGKGLDNLQKLPSKVSMLFDKITGKKPNHQQHDHQQSAKPRHKKSELQK